jgi:hypothetical protein
MAAAIKIAGVDQVYAGVERGADSGDAFAAVGWAVKVRHAHCAKANGGNGRPILPKSASHYGTPFALNMARGKVLRKSPKNQIYFARMRKLAMWRDKNGLNPLEKLFTLGHGSLAHPKTPSSAPH